MIRFLKNNLFLSTGLAIVALTAILCGTKLYCSDAWMSPSPSKRTGRVPVLVTTRPTTVTTTAMVDTNINIGGRGSSFAATTTSLFISDWMNPSKSNSGSMFQPKSSPPPSSSREQEEEKNEEITKVSIEPKSNNIQKEANESTMVVQKESSITEEKIIEEKIDQEKLEHESSHTKRDNEKEEKETVAENTTKQATTATDDNNDYDNEDRTVEYIEDAIKTKSRIQGVVQWYYVLRGYGFIQPFKTRDEEIAIKDSIRNRKNGSSTPPLGTCVFVHQSVIQSPDDSFFRKLYMRETVDFEVVQEKETGKISAINVTGRFESNVRAIAKQISDRKEQPEQEEEL